MTTRQSALPLGELSPQVTERVPSGELSPLAVTEAVPTIVCCDMWPPGRLTQVKLDAYKRLIDEGMIRIRRVVHHRSTGITVVDYWSQLPHSWTLAHLKKTAALLDPGQQMRLEAIL